MTIDSEAAVAAVLAIHRRYISTLYRNGRTLCVHDHEAWPCITARACGVTADHVSEATG